MMNFSEFITKNKTNIAVNAYVFVAGLGFDAIAQALGAKLTIEERWVFYCGIRCVFGVLCLFLMHSSRASNGIVFEYLSFSVVVIGMTGVISVPLLNAFSSNIFFQHIVFFAGRVAIACKLKQKWGVL